MSLVFDLIKAFSLGVISFYAIGLVGALVLPWERGGRDLVDGYAKLGASFLGRGLGMLRKHGGMTIIRTSYNAALGAETAKVDGEVYHWQDPKGMMTTFYGRPFGIVHEDRNVIVDARTCDLGRRFRELKESGEWIVDGKRKAYFVLDRARNLVSPSDVLSVIPGSSSPRLTERLDKFVEKEQALYDSKRAKVAQTAQLLMILGAGMGVVWLGAELQSSTGGSVSGISIGYLLLFGSTGVDRETIVDAGQAVLVSVALLCIGAALGIAMVASSIGCGGAIGSSCVLVETARTYGRTLALVGGGSLLAGFAPAILWGDLRD